MSEYIGVDLESAGAAVWWRLHGSMNLAVLEEAWLVDGLDKKLLPRPPSPMTALSRAARSQADSRTLIRSLGEGKWAIVNEQKLAGDLSYSIQAKLALDSVGRIVVEPADHPKAQELSDLYQHYLQDILPADVSPWLCKLMGQVQAVSLRDVGGVYFVPKGTLGDWKRIACAIRASSEHVLLGMPCMKTSEAIESIVDALAQEAKREAAALEAELANVDSPLGKSAITSRLAKADGVKAKIHSYEGLLGKQLQELHSRMDEVKAKLSKARLTLEGSSLSDVNLG